MEQSTSQGVRWGYAHEFVVEEEPEEDRLDLFLRRLFSGFSRNQLQRLIKEGHVLVDGQSVKPTYRPRRGNRITINFPEPKQILLEPKPVKFEILFEDEWIVVVSKPPSLVVHPSPGHEELSLVHGLLFMCGDRLSGVGGELRPGIVHRLDAGTSGVLVVAKSDYAHRFLAEQFASRKVYKLYDAIVCGEPKEEVGVVEAPIGRHPVDRKRMAVVPDGRDAVSEFRVVERFGLASWLQIMPKTGRTHQIRVHMKYIGCPILGDAVYGERANRVVKKLLGELPGRPMLHATKLGFYHPGTGNYMEFVAGLPADFQQWLNKLKNLKAGLNCRP